MDITSNTGRTAAKTKLINLVTLCRFHHRLVHEGGVRVKFLMMARSDLRSRAENRTRTRFRSLQLTRHLLRSYGSRCPAQWNGDKMDYGLAVLVLMQKEARAGAGRAVWFEDDALCGEGGAAFDPKRLLAISGSGRSECQHWTLAMPWICPALTTILSDI